MISTRLFVGNPAMRRTLAAAALVSSVACGGEAPPDAVPAAAPDDAVPPAAPTGPAFTVAAGTPFDDHAEERRLVNVRQLTFDGENAEAYFSSDGTRLVFQRTPAEGGCDQIHTIDLATGEMQLVSTGEGRTTCSYYYPAGDRILYSSTHLADDACPAPPDMSQGYVWAVYPTYDVFVANADGSDPRPLTRSDSYDAEATISPAGDRIVFTSTRDGDLDLYSMNLDGSDVRRLTDRVGYDGGAFYSPDGTRIVWRAHYPETDEEIADYRHLLAQNLLRPGELEIRVMNADGTGQRQVTSNGAANFGPFWHPDGERIVFSSNMDDPAGRNFDLYLIHEDGTGLERITYTDDFDGFPMFSPDGRYLVWGSNRNPSHPGNTNVFIAEWVEG
jgi:Tol biopolymer transport system component